MLMTRKEIAEVNQEEVYKKVCDGFLKITLDLFIMYDEGKIKLVNVNSKFLDEKNLGTLPASKYKTYVSDERIYDSHKELFDAMDMDIGIENDLEEMKDELYDKNGNWVYPISLEDIVKLKSFGEEIDISFLEKEENKNLVQRVDDEEILL